MRLASLPLGPWASSPRQDRCAWLSLGTPHALAREPLMPPLLPPLHVRCAANSGRKEHPSPAFCTLRCARIQCAATCARLSDAWKQRQHGRPDQAACQISLLATASISTCPAQSRAALLPRQCHSVSEIMLEDYWHRTPEARLVLLAQAIPCRGLLPDCEQGPLGLGGPYEERKSRVEKGQNQRSAESWK